MKLTRYTDYALRVLIYLGINPDRQCSIAEIASSYGISENHLMKVVQQLARDGFLASTRGRGGGIRLGKEPAEIRIGSVVRLTEPDMDLAECSTCVIHGVCGLTSAFGRATSAFLHVLDEYTLADVVRSGDSLRALLRLGLQPKTRKHRRESRSQAPSRKKAA
jgi:Rrf2 family nitric oxide-sensitive transcriptional repressor